MGRIAPEGWHSYTPHHNSRATSDAAHSPGNTLSASAGEIPRRSSVFVAYFEQLLRIKLRARMLPWETVEDLHQEPSIRVLANLRKGEDAVREPGALWSLR